MKIPEFGTLPLTRTNEQHFGQSRITPVTHNRPGLDPISSVKGVNSRSEAASISRTGSGRSFQDYLLEAVNQMNDQQVQVSGLQEKLITNPDEVDIHDVTIAMSKARMSLNLAQTVIDRLVTGWNEITTTR